MPTGYEISKKNYVKFGIFRNKYKWSGIMIKEVDRNRLSKREVIRKDFSIKIIVVLY